MPSPNFSSTSQLFRSTGLVIQRSGVQRLLKSLQQRLIISFRLLEAKEVTLQGRENLLMIPSIGKLGLLRLVLFFENWNLFCKVADLKKSCSWLTCRGSRFGGDLREVLVSLVVSGSNRSYGQLTKTECNSPREWRSCRCCGCGGR